MTTIREDYVSFCIAKLLREKGFDWDDSPFLSEQEKDEWIQNNSYSIPNPNYNADIPFDSETITMTAPHISLQNAMKWLREVHHLHITINYSAFLYGTHPYYWSIDKMNTIPRGNTQIETSTNTHDYSFMYYETACEAAIKYCLENLIHLTKKSK